MSPCASQFKRPLPAATLTQVFVLHSEVLRHAAGQIDREGEGLPPVQVDGVGEEPLRAQVGPLVALHLHVEARGRHSVAGHVEVVVLQGEKKRLFQNNLAVSDPDGRLGD